MKKPLWFIVMIYLLLLPGLSIASQKLQFSIASWQLDDIQAKNLNSDIQLTEKGLLLSASADWIKLAEPIGTIKDITLQCAQLVFVSEQLSCSKGRLAFIHQQLGEQSLIFEVIAHPDTNTYKVEISGIKLASSVFSLTVKINQHSWKIFADSAQIELKALMQFIAPYLSAEQSTSLAAWNYEGKLQLDIDVMGINSKVESINLDLKIQALELSDNQGKYISEQLLSDVHLSLENKRDDWQWQSKVNINGGQAYADPVFIDFNDTPFELLSEGVWLNKSKQFQLTKTRFEQKSVMALSMKGRGSLSQIESLNVEIMPSELQTLYSIWGQPFTLGTPMDSLDFTGKLGLTYQQQGDNYHVSMNMDKISVSDQAGRFSLDNLSGVFGWSNYQQIALIDIEWTNGMVYALTLGPSHLKANVEHETVVLQQPWLLPILDGELHMTEFSLKKHDNDLPEWTFVGELTPISMTSLSSALGWPVMHGKLSGVIPKVSYANQQVKVDGILKVNLFEGETLIRDLQLDNPFGVLPHLSANVTMDNINLETLTQTFDFGKITGKLDGKVNGLRLSNWKPVAFDAEFSTPEGDKSRRRISQKAVDSLSRVGGGAAGVLQRSFLRFFEDFSYQRLGLSCKLQNTVCDMSGVGEAEQGYYIVKGGGLPPRINVIGYTRRVNWPDLIERLEAVSNSDGPIIQ